VKKYIVLILMVLGAAAAAAQVKVGLGVEVGSESGINAKFVNPTRNWTEVMLAWGINDRFFMQGTYNFVLKDITERKPGQIELYAGPGLFIRSPERGNNEFGIAGMFGMGVMAQKQFEFMVEVSPRVGFPPSSGSDFLAGFGSRYIF
jgi:hypothetical protein